MPRSVLTLALRAVAKRRASVTMSCSSRSQSVAACPGVSDEPGLAPAVRVLSDEGLVHKPLVYDHVEHRQQQIEVRSGADLQVHVGELRSLGPARIDHDERA